MGRFLLIGGIAAAAASVFMRRSTRKTNSMNKMLNMMINMMGSLGVFRLIGRSRMFKNAVRAR